MTDPFPPEHMDKYSRNERLYRFLLSMGLIVNPVRLTDDLSKIDHLYVTVALSANDAAFIPGSERSSEAGVVGVVERSEVGEIVRPAKGDGNVVVDFPPRRPMIGHRNLTTS